MTGGRESQRDREGETSGRSGERWEMGIEMRREKWGWTDRERRKMETYR